MIRGEKEGKKTFARIGDVFSSKLLGTLHFVNKCKNDKIPMTIHTSKTPQNMMECFTFT